ncbi:cytochrome P450 [Actinomadura sp. PM05-2]|uniref:Cytochrome P450 n=1 Tax=Actinomadura parmotrematis TaxID=2864039 RepID=A0ABS7FYQ5_9ACTN|nr:cytochrome P450 [Actinomadura parmotrematis]
MAAHDALAASDPGGAALALLGLLRTDWRALLAELRAARPVLVTPAFTLVTRMADVREVLSLERVFTVADYARRLDPALGGPCVLTQDATPLKWRERGLMQVALAPEDVPRVRAVAGRAADEALDRAAPAGRVDVVQEVFRPAALRVCAEHLGFAGPDPATMSRWSREVIGHATANPLDDPAVRDRALAAGGAMMEHLHALVGARGGGPPADSVAGRLLGTRPPGGAAIGDDRRAVIVASLLLGFLENAAGSLVNLVGRLLARPGLHAEAAAAATDPRAFEPYVWEALRFDPFLKVIARRSRGDHVLAAGTPRATLVPDGTLVLAVAASAMFDADALPAPEEFRLDRPRHSYLHFGLGHHDCVGGDVGAATVAETARRLLLRPGLRTLPGEDVARDRGVFPDRWILGLGRPGDADGAEEH